MHVLNFLLTVKTKKLLQNLYNVLFSFHGTVRDHGTRVAMFLSQNMFAEIAKAGCRNKTWISLNKTNTSSAVIPKIGHRSEKLLSDVNDCTKIFCTSRWVSRANSFICEKMRYRSMWTSQDALLGRIATLNGRWISSVTPDSCTACGDLTDPWLSPISIDGNAAKPMEYCHPLLYHNYWHSEGLASLFNNGKTVEIKVKRSRYKPVLCGGPLPEPYKLDQFHFHWGPSNQQGSEHLINGKRYAMEVHLIHCAEKYKSLDEACDYKKGIAVVAVLLKATASVPHFDFEHLVSRLPLIKSPNTSATLSADKAISWLRCRALNSGYYTYKGTLTYPLGGRDVIWIVYPNPIAVTPSQVDGFRNLLSLEQTPITNNCMELREGKREVEFCPPHDLSNTVS